MVLGRGGEKYGDFIAYENEQMPILEYTNVFGQRIGVVRGNRMRI